jgi:hypothetical protein
MNIIEIPATLRLAVPENATQADIDALVEEITYQGEALLSGTDFDNASLPAIVRSAELLIKA